MHTSMLYRLSYTRWLLASFRNVLQGTAREGVGGSVREATPSLEAGGP